MKAELPSGKHGRQQSTLLLSLGISKFTASLKGSLAHSSRGDTHSFKCLLAQLTHVSALLVHLQLHLDQLGGNVLLLLLGAALLLTDLPIHVAIGVLKDMVSCYNDLFDVPAAWEKVGRQLGSLQDRALPNKPSTGSAFHAERRTKGILNLQLIMATFSLCQHKMSTAGIELNI